MRGDLDEYRPVDQQGLQLLIAAASLAFAHSAAYEQQLKSQAEIRQLYQDKQAARDAAAVDLARKLHDQIINGGVQQNVVALKKIVRQQKDDELRNILAPVLESEQRSLYKLRRISDELHPRYIDDPLGLPLVLRNEVERQQEIWKTWEGQCRLEVSGSCLPLSQRTQWEAFRITGEAITNAIKHADATMITVHLQYPTGTSKPVKLVIHDNGRSARAIAEGGVGRGVRYMEESARAGGGTLEIQVDPGKSTAVIFTFPATIMPAEQSEEQKRNESGPLSVLSPTRE